MCLCCNEDLKKISGDSWCFPALKQFFKGLVLQKHECTFIYRCTICRCKIYWNVHFTTARFLLGKHRSTRQFFLLKRTSTHVPPCRQRVLSFGLIFRLIVFLDVCMEHQCDYINRGNLAFLVALKYKCISLNTVRVIVGFLNIPKNFNILVYHCAKKWVPRNCYTFYNPVKKFNILIKLSDYHQLRTNSKYFTTHYKIN